MPDEYDVDDDDDDDDDETANSTNPVYHLPHSSAIDITADELVPLLTAENVANLVLLSMVCICENIYCS
ncbi:unnamed protein product [Clavelina lepadiformis]|uniref:Uncharacterized protein n=1 Tax=Clavelina lepadiformis TaxID=159417 RepID=A0ABP0GE96_CLALP